MLTHRNQRRRNGQRRVNVYCRFTLALSLLVLTCGIAHADTPDEAAIRGVLNAQVAAWNRGDVVTFMQGYRNSPTTTFIGKTLQHGYANILARYQKNFAGKEKMGQLNFSDLEVHQLDAHFATVTGRFHLARSADAGGDAEGIFSLVFEKSAEKSAEKTTEKTASGWKIILDHTS
jgi:ketosteroid isomerase-like protein